VVQKFYGTVLRFTKRGFSLQKEGIMNVRRNWHTREAKFNVVISTASGRRAEIFAVRNIAWRRDSKNYSDLHRAFRGPSHNISCSSCSPAPFSPVQPRIMNGRYWSSILINRWMVDQQGIIAPTNVSPSISLTKVRND